MTNIPIEWVLEPYIPPGDLSYLNCTNWKWLEPIDTNWKSLSEEHLVHQGEQMYEHIAYKLRYRNLSSIEHGSICMKAHLFI